MKRACDRIYFIYWRSRVVYRLLKAAIAAMRAGKGTTI
jgi:hypothetical protein